MDILTVERDWKSSYNQTTILKDNKNKVVAIIGNHIKQPKKGTATIILKKLGKQTEYKLNWSKIN